MLLRAYNGNSLGSHTLVFTPYVELAMDDDGDDKDYDGGDDGNSTHN